MMGIYIGYDSPSIIRYLEPLTSDLFTACFTNGHFYETVFPLLGEIKTSPILKNETNYRGGLPLYLI